MYKLNLVQFIAFSFMVGWVGMDVIHADYHQKLFWATVLAFGTAYFENAHGKFWKYLKTFFKNKKH